MRFIATMTLREMRASWRRLLFFFICLSIGIGAIVAIRSVIQNVRVVFARGKAFCPSRSPPWSGRPIAQAWREWWS